MDLHRRANGRLGCRLKGNNMRNRRTVWAVVSLVAGITLAIFLPGIINAGPDRFGSFPGWDHLADQNKSVMVGPSGTDVRWKYGTNVILNVRDFGAIPNDGLDDSSAINTLIASTAATGLTNNNGVQIYIPKGTYDLTSPIRVNRQVVIFGDGGSGDHSSTILKPAKNITGIQIDGIATSTDGGQGDWSTVRDFSVQYASQTTANWLPSHAYVLNDTVKSLITGSGVNAVAGPNWNPDVVFKCTTAGTSAGSEPAWGSKTEGQTITDGGVTWTAIVVAGVRMRARANVQNFMINNSPGQGVRVDGDSSGSPSTNANGFRVQYGRFVAPAQDALRIVGIDSNAGQARDLDVAGCGYYGVDDQSFLGNLHEGHQVANCLLGPYKSPGLNARSEFIGCYSESGQPPSSISSPSLVVGGLHGAGFSTGGTQGTVYGSQLITSATLEHQPVPNTGGTYFTAPYADGYAFRWGSADTFFSMKYAATCLFSGTKCWRMSAENSDATAVFDLSGSDSSLAGNIKGFMGFPRGFFMGPFVQYISHTDIDPSTHEPFSSPSPLRRGAWYWNVAGTTNNGPIEQGGQGPLSGGVIGWQKVHDATYSAGPDYFTVRTPHFGVGNTIDVTNTQGSIASPRALDHLHEAGVTFTNAGATGEVGLKLPSIGGNFTPKRTVEFSFYVADTDGMRISSFDSNRKIQWGNHPVADYIESFAIGSFVRLKAEFDMNNILNGWTFAVIQSNGPWTDSNGLVMNMAGGPASAVTGDVVSFSDASGSKFSDTGILAANIVQTSRQVIAGTGITITPQAQLTSDITVSINGPTGQGATTTRVLRLNPSTNQFVADTNWTIDQNDALVCSAKSGSNATAMTVTGDGTGQGIHAFAGGTNGTGLWGTGFGTGIGVFGENSGGNGQGVVGNGHGPFAGVAGVGGAGGNGVEGTGGSAGAGGVFTGTTTGPGVQAFGGTSNGIGVQSSGSGTAAGVQGTGGSSSGPGVKGIGGSNGHGIVGQGTGSGNGGDFTGGNSAGFGVNATGGGTVGDAAGGNFTGGLVNGAGIQCQGTGNGAGVSSIGGSNNGIGVSGTGGGTGGIGGTFAGIGTGAGMTATAGGTNAKGGIFTGSGTGVGIQTTGGATSAAGINATGGSSNGQGGIFNGVGSGNGLTGNGGTTNGSAGIFGTSLATNGVGVSGQGVGNREGVTGSGGSTAGPGVIGTGGANGTGVVGNGGAGVARGVVGSATGNEVGVVGNGGPSGGIGVLGSATAGNARGVQGTGSGNEAGIFGIGGTSAGLGAFGQGGTNGGGMQGLGNGTGYGVRGDGGATSGNGVYGVATSTGITGFGVAAENTSGGYAMSILGDQTSPVRASMHWATSDAQPTGAHVIGDAYMTAAGDIQVCTTAGTPGTWQRVGRLGTATNNNATAGDIGEFVESKVALGSAVTLTNATSTNITSISLTAGDWDVTGICNVTGGAVTGTALDCGISTTSATLPAAGSKGDTWVESPTMATAGADTTLAVPEVRALLSATTTYFLVVQDSFTVGSPKGYGRISARRRR